MYGQPDTERDIQLFGPLYLPSVSTSNWVAMMNGVGPEGTGAINNLWVDGTLSFPYIAMTTERKLPNIFRIIHEQKPDVVMGCIHN
ncbi:hypothetical protein FACS1894181_14950 [Bacteroidia bacterium]|nr:hypothetical protein FACS1894181_14950 [Bacteroidia bacterium]